MSWYSDMSKVTMADAGDHIGAVGWLSAKHHFPKGDVPAEFLARLKEFVKRSGDSMQALGWGYYCGYHDCELCLPEGDGSKAPSDGRHGVLNLGIPCGKLLFAAPELVGHYVEKHRYQPPKEFITAVMQSPLPGTDQYRAVAEPFRRLHFQYLLRQYPDFYERCLRGAAQWAFDQGRDEEAVPEAALRFFYDKSPDVCERIRLALRHVQAATGPSISVTASRTQGTDIEVAQYFGERKVPPPA